MTIFKNKEAIYLQIAALFSENVLMKIWRSGDKLPSIQDTAVAFEVNPHTSQRTFHYLQQKGTIRQKEDNSYYLSGDSYEKMLELRRDRFIADELPLLLERMSLLDISLADLMAGYENFKRNSKKG